MWSSIELFYRYGGHIELIGFKATCKRAQQLPILLRACWQWCANGCNNSQQVWDLQCIVGRIQPISLCNPCVMSMRGAWPQQCWKNCKEDLTLLRYASVITEQKKCWELLTEKFDRFQTLRNNTQQHVTSNNVGSCWPTMLRLLARGLKGHSQL